MSGLCGWFSHEPAALPIARMAAPLSRLDQAPLRTASHSAGTVALAGGLDRAGLYHEDGLLIAYWGERVDALARLWRLHGAKACSALSGHFAFALLDERRGEALLAVDRAGTRPLYYQLVGHTLVFASRADALVLHPGAGRDIDPQTLYNYVHFCGVPGPAVIYKGQRKLAPGEFIHLHGGRLERGRYWRLRFHEHEAGELPLLRDELVDTLRGAVEGSLGQHQVGVMLGGGVHSAALAALAQTEAGGAVPTCAAGADTHGRGALGAARRLNSTHHERVVGPGDVADAIPQLAAGFDQPYGDPAALGAFHCALAAREAGIQRLLGGTGASLLFGVRPPCAAQLRLSSYERLPAALRQLVFEPMLFRVAGSLHGPVAALRERVVQAMEPLPARLRHASALAAYGASNVFEADFLDALDPGAPQAAQEQAWWLAQGRDELNRMIAVELQYGLADRTLPALEQACQLAGIEVAWPYLSDAMVAFAARVEPRLKRQTAWSRGLLHSALRTVLPPRLAAARGRCFELPLGRWLQADTRLRTIAFDSLNGLRRRHIVRGDFIDTLLARHLPAQPARHGAMVWMLMMLEQWLAQHPGGSGLAPVRRRVQASVSES
ncbi:asparagine synthetase B family protein [Massilia horti]|uniref:asparagine synthase (glutamine-hydrolyzing) n=1 Tax=Massilia horti TaxID=2562153 RepID=A0A4Y9T5H8_9BURK|nr:asparagine synthase-related protein [Massilia horti]TFW35383.1 asparagine synthase [Massilia horti]